MVIPDVLCCQVWGRRPLPRVWVLMGGDGPGRQAALATGVNVVTKLKRYSDIQVSE